MKPWPEHLEECANCTGGAFDYAYGARGYCSRCYRIIRRIEDVRAWDREHPETRKSISKDEISDPEFARFQKRIIQQLKARLNLLHRREEIRRQAIPVTALMLERKFAEVLHLIRPKAKYPSNASHLNKNFSDEERRVIYALLEEIIEQNHWRGIEWIPVYRDLYDDSSDGWVDTTRRRR